MSPRFEARRNLYMAGIDSEVMVYHHKPWIHLNSSQLKDEFVSCMKNPRIVAYMSSVGVSVHDVQHLFKIVANENDEVDIDRFVDGCDLARIAFCFSWLLTGYATSSESVNSSWMELLFQGLHLPGMAIKGSASALDMQKQLYYMQSVTKTLNTWERHYWPRLLRATWNQRGWDGWRLMKGEGRGPGTCTPQWGHPVIYKVVRKLDQRGKTWSQVQLLMLYLGMKVNEKNMGCGLHNVDTYIILHIFIYKHIQSTHTYEYMYYINAWESSWNRQNTTFYTAYICICLHTVPIFESVC